MTEPEWLASENPQGMLTWIHCGPRPSDRKLRMSACACCRTAWDELDDPRSRAALEAAECLADGKIGEGERHRHHIDAQRADNDNPRGPAQHATWAVEAAISHFSAQEAARIASQCFKSTPAAIATILREVVGNPFRPVTLPKGPKCQNCSAPYGDRQYECPCNGKGFLPCPWLTPTVLMLADSAYEDRRADGTLDPITLLALADALEEAGCDSKELLMHLRGEEWYQPSGGGLCKRPIGPHWRGCHVIDTLLGKE